MQIIPGGMNFPDLANLAPIIPASAKDVPNCTSGLGVSWDVKNAP